MIAAILPDWLNADALWIIATGAVTAAACAVLGTFLVLRRMSMMGDAISHAVLPGIAAAFLLTESYAVGWLLFGAIVAGLATAALTQTLHRYAHVAADASMGVVFTSLFALGVVLITQVKGVHFDKQCVFEGALELTPLYVVEIAGREYPRALVVGGGVLALNLLVLGVLWKEFKLSAFDAALADTMGFSSGVLHYLLMALVAITAVASFEAVGSILVVSMLIIPAATAHLLVDRLAPMVAVAAGLGALASALGYALAVRFDVNVAGMMAVAAGGLYGLAVLLSPRYGIVSAVVRNARLSLRVVRDDLLGMLYRLEELGATRRMSAAEARSAVGGGAISRTALASLVRAGQVAESAGQLSLTAAGRDAARQLVRAHRLWENYLVEYLGLPLDHVHEPANRVEHYLDPTLRESLEKRLGDATTDPHGREIPK